MISRRSFIVKSAFLTTATALFSPVFSKTVEKVKSPKVKVGIIGVGNRGIGLMNNIFHMDDVEIVAICDLFKERVDKAVTTCESKGRKKPRTYCNDENTWMNMLDKEKLDAVIIATYWDVHCPMALYSMGKNIYPGIEVPAALTINDCWDLVNRSEETGISMHDVGKLELPER